MTNTDNRRELEKALEQLELAIDLKSDEAADAYAAGKKVEWRSLVKAFLALCDDRDEIAARLEDRA